MINFNCQCLETVKNETFNGSIQCMHSLFKRKTSVVYLICDATASTQPPISILTCLRYLCDCTSSNIISTWYIWHLLLTLQIWSTIFYMQDRHICISSESFVNFYTALAYPMFVFTTKNRIRNNTEIIQPTHEIIILFSYWIFPQDCYQKLCSFSHFYLNLWFQRFLSRHSVL